MSVAEPAQSQGSLAFQAVAKPSLWARLKALPLLPLLIVVILLVMALAAPLLTP